MSFNDDDEDQHSQTNHIEVIDLICTVRNPDIDNSEFDTVRITVKKDKSQSVPDIYQLFENTEENIHEVKRKPSRIKRLIKKMSSRNFSSRFDEDSVDIDVSKNVELNTMDLHLDKDEAIQNSQSTIIHLTLKPKKSTISRLMRKFSSPKLDVESANVLDVSPPASDNESCANVTQPLSKLRKKSSFKILTKKLSNWSLKSKKSNISLKKENNEVSIDNPTPTTWSRKGILKKHFEGKEVEVKKKEGKRVRLQIFRRKKETKSAIPASQLIQGVVSKIESKVENDRLERNQIESARYYFGFLKNTKINPVECKYLQPCVEKEDWDQLKTSISNEYSKWGAMEDLYAVKTGYSYNENCQPDDVPKKNTSNKKSF